MESDSDHRSSEWFRRHVDDVDPASGWAVGATALLLGAMAGILVWVMMRHMGSFLG